MSDKSPYLENPKLSNLDSYLLAQDDTEVLARPSFPSLVSESKPKFVLEGYEERCKDPKSFGDYIKAGAVIATVPFAVLYDLFHDITSNEEDRVGIKDTIRNSIVRHFCKYSTLTQLRMLTGRKALKLELSHPFYWLQGTNWSLPSYNKLFVSDAYCNARWISEVPDRKHDDPVLLYFHGGGFALKISPPQVEYICDLARILLKYRVSVLALDYTITPFARFPSQRYQALFCLQSLQACCSHIILFGDSCGGNLALSVLLEETGDLKLDHERILGCVLVSAWTDPGATGSAKDFAKDILSERSSNEMRMQFSDECDLENPQVSPLRAEAAVWKRVLPVNTLMVWGDVECLANQNVEFQKLAAVKNYYIEKNGTHDSILRGITSKPCQYITNQLLSWIGEASDSTYALANNNHA